MAENEMFKTTLMGGYDKDEVHEQIQKMKDEMAEQQLMYRKQLAEKDSRIAELEKRIELKEASQEKLEADVRDKYQKYIDNYESIGRLVFEAQLRADAMVKETEEKCSAKLEDAEEKCGAMLRDAEAQARQKVESVEKEIEEKLQEGRKKYQAVQEETNSIVELINQAQKRFMSSYREVHQIISNMPTAISDMGDEGILEMPADTALEEQEEDRNSVHLGDTEELDIMDSMRDIEELEEFDDEDEEEDEDSRIALQISRLLSEEDEAMLEEEQM